MSLVPSSVMANAVMAKFYDVLTNGDDTVPKSEDNFFSWCTPGIPIAPGDLDFLTQGLTGVVRKSALDEMRTTMTSTAGDGSAATAQPELTPELLRQLRASDTGRLYAQAESLSRLVDFVPDLADVKNNQFARLSVMNNEGSLSERYEYVLRMSQVVQSELPDETKKTIERLRAALTTVVTKKDIISGEEIQVTEPSQLVRAYNERMTSYMDAALEYNSHRINALAGEDPTAMHFWAINANILRNKVKAAMSDWEATGYKGDYEKIAAFISQVQERDMALLKQHYRDELDKARLTGLYSGSDFYHTSLVPGSFAIASGWTEFGFDARHFASYRSSSYSYSRESGGGSVGIFGFGASGGGSSASGQSQSHGEFESDTFKLNFKIAQAQIVRPWFKTAFLMSKSWRFDQSDQEAKGQVVSDGGDPAKGLIPAYPTAVIFIRDLRMCIAKSSGVTDMMSSYQRESAGGGGGFSFGPFSLAASYSSSSGSGQESHGYQYDSSTQTMRVPGMQIVGFKCHIVPKSPDPLSSITKWI